MGEVSCNLFPPLVPAQGQTQSDLLYSKHVHTLDMYKALKFQRFSMPTFCYPINIRRHLRDNMRQLLLSLCSSDLESEEYFQCLPVIKSEWSILIRISCKPLVCELVASLRTFIYAVQSSGSLIIFLISKFLHAINWRRQGGCHSQRNAL